MIEKRLLEELVGVQNELSEVSEGLKRDKENYEKMITSALEKKKSLLEQETEIKGKLTEQGLEEFKETKSKKLTGGLSIRETKKIDYDDKKAFEFALEKKLFLQLDKKAFEKSVDSLDLDFVTISKEPKVTFPKEIKLED